MGHNHRSLSGGLPFAWYDVLLFMAAGALLGFSPQLADHPELFSVSAALVVGTIVHRLFAWMEQVERRVVGSAALRRTSPMVGSEEPRHSARAA
jgi:Na+-transporting methylmalonyl-CoA/oxaloacetate decarboxylase beta subunit